ncbi:MAG: M20/M25/M40 family metallo-hydrolase [Candidatus Uhrbacteria bacterium]
MDALAILERLVAIPSWRTAENPAAEAEVSSYLTDVIRHELPWFHVNHQQVEGGRYNIFLTDGAPVRILFAVHMDTMPPGTEWKYRITGERVGDRFYGRGALDVKGGIAALLAALVRVGATEGIGVLLYCDEEYDFHGMRRFLAEERTHPEIELLVAIEPTMLRVRNGCRGIAEFRPVIRGVSGHSARPSCGKSAIAGFMRGVDALEKLARQSVHPTFGRMTCNIAALRCGLSRGRHDGRELIDELASVIPDYAEGIVEIRTPPGIHIEECVAAFNRGVREVGCRTASIATRFGLQSYHTALESLELFTDAVRAVCNHVPLDDLSATGYCDVQLLASRFDAPCVQFGPSGGQVHAADEYVEIESITTLQAILERVAKTHRRGGAGETAVGSQKVADAVKIG